MKLENFSHKRSALLWTATGILLCGLILFPFMFPGTTWLLAVIAGLLVLVMVGLIRENRKVFSGRTFAFGLNSAVTVILVIAIMGVINFLAYNAPYKLDFTKNKVHTLSDQTTKVVKGLSKDVKFVLFSPVGMREQHTQILDNYRALNSKLTVEFVDPNKEITRVQQSGVREMNTLQINVGERNSLITEINEEKITNALLKLLKDRAPTFCAVTGHDERSFESKEAGGYSKMKESIEQQNYKLKEVMIAQLGKIPDDCDAIGIIGPSKAFFDKELAAIRDYLANGGRAVIALDIDLKGTEKSQEMVDLLKEWHLNAAHALVLDPAARQMNSDYSIPVANQFSKDSPITKEFRANNPCLFPFTRPLAALPGAPAGLTANWLVKTFPTGWAETNFKDLSKGVASPDKGVDQMGAQDIAMAIEGKQKDSKASRNTRIVVFGTSLFANNQFSRFGANTDLFMNSISWAIEDESMISIRAKEDDPGLIELTANTFWAIFFSSVVIFPMLIVVAGIVVWLRRRKL